MAGCIIGRPALIPLNSSLFRQEQDSVTCCLLRMQSQSIQFRFKKALDELIERIREDRSILAAILCGSLSYDTVWEKSDIDLALVTIDDKKVEEAAISLFADGINVHAFLFPRSEFRFNSETLEVTVRGKTIDDILNMSVEKGVTFFAGQPAVGKKVEVLNDLGLGYLTLGQSATTLSGGEAQRIKIATELSKLQRAKHTVYILDEPTTGLHLADVERLLESLNKLVDAGHTVLLIEHHLDVIKTADHVIDLGPEGGHAGGEVVVTGTPEEIAACRKSYTGSFLKSHLTVARRSA